MKRIIPFILGAILACTSAAHAQSISSLPSANTPLAGTEVIIVNQDGVTKRATAGDISQGDHTVGSHSDTTASGAELETLTDGSSADALHAHPTIGGIATIKENDAQVGGADISILDFLGADFDLVESPDTEIQIVIAPAIARDSELHAESHAVASHSDTTATGAELETLTDGSSVSTLHVHPALFDYADFTLDIAAPSFREGRVFWNNEDATFSVMPDVDGPILQVGQEMWIRVINKTGLTLNDGDAVYISGAQGNRPTAALADADSHDTSEVIGIITYDILDNAEGFATIHGLVRGFDTSTFVVGDELYLSSTAGELTKTAPTPPAHKVLVAHALNATASGTIIVNPVHHAVHMPPTSTDNALVRFDGTDSDQLQNSTVLVDDTGVMTGGTWQGNAIAETYLTVISDVFDCTTGDCSTVTVETGEEILVNSGGEVEATETVISVNNDSGATIYACTAVYISGFDIPSDLPKIGIADADDPAKMPALGLVESDIANGASGKVIIVGAHETWDTGNAEVWTAGTPLYVNTSGTSADSECGNTLTDTRPTGTTTAIQKMGAVGRTHGTQGEIVVSGANRSNDVPNLEDAKFWLGNGTNVATQVAMSADVTIDNLGVATVANDSHTHGTSSLAGIDIGDDTNLAGTANEITLTGDVLSLHTDNALDSELHNESHAVASHSDTTATGAELETLTDTSNADALHSHAGGSGSMTTVKENDAQVGGADIVTIDFLGADFDVAETPDTEIQITIAGAIARDVELHNESHTVASHSDTTGTGAELEELTDGSTSTLHAHTIPAHTVASHSDTTATGAELETLTDDSNANALHFHGTATKTTAAGYTIGTTDPNEKYGGVIYVTSAATIVIPAVAVEMSFTVITIGATAVSVDPNASDKMYLDGVLLDDGDQATNTSTTGDALVCSYFSADGWYCMSGSPDGDPWTDGS